MERFSTTLAQTDRQGARRDREVAYGNFVREPLQDLRARRSAAPQRSRGEGRVDSDRRGGARPHPPGAEASPFVIKSVVVGNVQYPEAVSAAVSRKLAATQELQRKDTEIEIERKERTKREVQAQGIANAMNIIRGQLTGMYIQHEAIEAQKQMVGSPNHTVVYIPRGRWASPHGGGECRQSGAAKVNERAEQGEASTQ